MNVCRCFIRIPVFSFTLATMSALRRGALYITPWMQCRHRGKIQIKKPKAGPLERRILDAITQPILPLLPHQIHKECSIMKKKLWESTQVVEVKDNGYERFLVKRCKAMLDQSNMLLVLQPMSMTFNKQKEISYKFYQHNLLLRQIGNKIISQAVEGTKWINVSPLFTSHTIFLFGKETKVKEVIKLTANMPELVLLGGAVNDRILTRADLTWYANLPDIDILRSQMVGILNLGASKTRSLLGSHQQRLCANLTQYAKDQEEEGTS